MLTAKELYVIEAIVSNEFTNNNYYLPPYTESYEDAGAGDSCWTDMINQSGAKHGTRVEGKELSGVLSSLNKKDYVRSNSGSRGTARVTKEGWAAYQSAMSAGEAVDAFVD